MNKLMVALKIALVVAGLALVAPSLGIGGNLQGFSPEQPWCNSSGCLCFDSCAYPDPSYCCS